MKRHCANSILLFSQAVRFTFQMYAHLLLLQHRDCPRLLHLRLLYQPYDRGCLRSQYSTSSSSVPTSTRCLVRFCLDTGDAMQQYPDSEGHVQNRLVKASLIFVLASPSPILVCLLASYYLFQTWPMPIFSFDRSVTEALFVHLYSIPSSTQSTSLSFPFSFHQSVCYAQYLKS
jgi:hypothetical protein